ncbi:MAG: DUF3857 domain-containing protein, partial [Candidatus Latescibacteria bacterium]|nr:DUF3857 domain-containing protein [bacterium]MBD3423609.1 DUF3857 domain-containing protein [Candidatus Latescibacterota bacterium]
MKLSAFIAVSALLILIPSVIFTAEMGESGGYDLDSLLEKAEKDFELSENDAVFLLKRKNVEVTPSGDLKSTIHTVVRIATRSSIRSYADLRVPYNSATSSFKTIKLRTWNDGRWWPDSEEISETAVVHTTPAAVASASDYASMREVMLLHDGVELPCVMETEYQIIERGGAGKMPGGFEIFPQNDPAMVVEYSVTLPAGRDLKFSSGNGAPPPEQERSDGRKKYIWKMERVNRLGSPRIDNRSSYA